MALLRKYYGKHTSGRYANFQRYYYASSIHCFSAMCILCSALAVRTFFNFISEFWNHFDHLKSANVYKLKQIYFGV